MFNIEKFDHEGRGITNIDNKIIFVEKALPNEIVDIEITEDYKNYSIAKIKNIIKKSPDRIESICPYYNECGGCDLLHLNYKLQTKFKLDKIKNIIEKNLDDKISIKDIITCKDNYCYRNKVTFHVNGDIGFFNKQSNKLVPISKCVCISNLINAEIINFKKLDLEEINQIICRVGNNKLMVVIDTNNSNLDISCIKHIPVIYIYHNNKYILKSKEKSCVI